MFHSIVHFILLFTILFSNSHVLAKPLSVRENKNIHYVKLDNGLSLYVVPNNRIPAAMHLVIYKVGGKDDPIGKAGLAHYFEHLMFETTGKFKDIESILGDIGARFNAFTTNEFTCYYELVHRKDLPLAMEIEADRMRSFNVSQDKIEREKNIVLEERKMRVENKPIFLLHEEMNNAFYRTSYGRPVVGWKKDIDSFTKVDIEKFHDMYYHPGNAILLIVGDVKLDEVLKLVEEKYGTIESKPTIVRDIPKEPDHVGNMLLTLESNQVSSPVLYFRYRVPPLLNFREVLIINLVTDILGSSKSSFLYEDLVLNKDIAVSAWASYNEGSSLIDGYLDIVVHPKTGVSLEKIEKELESSMNSFISREIVDNELKNAKYRYKAEVLSRYSSLEQTAFFYAINLILDVPLEKIDISYSDIDNITLKEINSKIHTILLNNKLIGRLLPDGGINNETK